MKIEEQVLSREQMAHLQELGIDTSDASMCWTLVRGYDSEQWAVNINNSIAKAVACINDNGTKRFIPTYTIGEIIEKVSKLFNGFDFSEGNLKDMLYSCLCWMAKNKKELIK